MQADTIGADALETGEAPLIGVSITLNDGSSASKSFATDGQTDANGTYIEIDGDYGTLKIYDDGSYTYTTNGTVDPHGRSVAGRRVQLRDRRRTTATPPSPLLTIEVTDDGPMIVDVSGATLYEANLTDAVDPGTSPNAAALTVTPGHRRRLRRRRRGRRDLHRRQHRHPRRARPDLGRQRHHLRAVARRLDHHRHPRRRRRDGVHRHHLRGTRPPTNGPTPSPWARNSTTTPGSATDALSALPFEIVATDGDGSTDTADFTVNVMDDEPVAVSILKTSTVDEDDLTTAEGASFNGTDGPVRPKSAAIWRAASHGAPTAKARSSSRSPPDRPRRPA